MNGINSHLYLIGNALVGTEQKHQVISQNIANVNTPGYKTKELAFGEFLKSVENGDAKNGFIEQMDVQLVEGLEDRIDGNNVNIDQQIGELNKNALMNQVLSELLISKMAMINKAISG